jgi:hypothetical protein
MQFKTDAIPYFKVFAYLFFVETKFCKEIVFLDYALHALEQREQRVLRVQQHFALPFVLSLFEWNFADARKR